MNSSKPNIILILLDDLGWRDLACTGSDFYETPNIDKLAEKGITFTSAYASCPVCSPSRASIMTGKYPATVGITDWIDHGGYRSAEGVANRRTVYQTFRAASSHWLRRCVKVDITPGTWASGTRGVRGITQKIMVLR